MFVGTYMPRHVCEDRRDSMCELGLSFDHMCSRVQTQSRLGGKCLYLLGHLAALSSTCFLRELGMAIMPSYSTDFTISLALVFLILK